MSHVTYEEDTQKVRAKIHDVKQSFIYELVI